MVDRFIKAFKYLEFEQKFSSQKEAALIIGIDQGNLSKALKGDKKYLTDSFLRKFNEAFNNIFDENWLLTGEGDMLKDEGSKEITDQENNDNYKLVPLINMDAVGGMHRLNDTCDTDKEYVERLIPFVDALEDDLCIPIVGTSMEPTCPPGSIVLIRNVPQWKEYFGFGNLFVIQLSDGRRILKEITKHPDNPKDYILCVSHNKSVPAEDLPKNMIDSVWKVIKILTNKGW